MANVEILPKPGSSKIITDQVSISLPSRVIRAYRHGWQSWSLAAWTTPTPLPVPKPTRFHTQQFDAEYAEETKPHGSWVGSVELENGTFLLLGAVGLGAHVMVEGGRLLGWSEAGEIEWMIALGEEKTIFSDYTQALSAHLGCAPRKPAPRIWCSWYSLYTDIDETILSQIFDQIGDLAFDVLQIDDGWQQAVGDWQPNLKFPSGMAALAGKIKRTQRTAGLWLAPLIAVEHSSLFRHHPDWFLRDERGRLVPAGFNWGGRLYALDTTLPVVSDWLVDLMRTVRNWGYDYIKLDFLYGGALKGKRHQDLPREMAYREALRLMREAIGKDGYLLTCGTPILPAIGLCDAMRIGQDVSGEWENLRDSRLFCNPGTPGVKNAIRTSINRLWLDPLVKLDPDVVYFSTRGNVLTAEQKTLLQDLALVTGYKATSDLPQWLTSQERDQLKSFLEADPVIKQIDRYTFTLDGRLVDFTPALPPPEAPEGLNAIWGAFIGKLANQPPILQLNKRIEDRKRRRLLQNLGIHPTQTT